MKRDTKYVGLDVHQATTVVAVRNESGRLIARTILDTEGEAIVEYFRGLRGSVHVAFEEGTQAQWLHDLLKPHVARVVVCDRHGEKRKGTRATGSMRRSWLTGCARVRYGQSIMGMPGA